MALLCASRCCDLAKPSPALDPVHTNADECCSLSWHLLPTTLALVLRSESCSLSQGSSPCSPTRPASSLRFHMFQWVLCLLGMLFPQSRPFHVPVDAAAWPRLASSQPQLPDEFLSGEVCGPVWLCLSQRVALKQTSRCCSPAEASPKVP